MREIKFRAWDGKKMLYGVLPWNNSAVIAMFSGNRNVITVKTTTQYTGLKDMRSTDIYEGDICHFKNIYEGEYTNVIVYYKNGFYLDNGLHSNWDAEYCEVIGNIYENPELLESK
jgi:hypothetical protein